ncbi:MAG TPA: hypothetical protein VGJ15_03155 [Pirellulales bacterium]|jgi:hypothetical protein
MVAAEWIIGVGALVAGIAVGVWLSRRHYANSRQLQLTEAQRLFHRMREQLEAKFLQKAALTGKPRGLRWADCEFENEVTYARDRQTRELSAFVAVSIKFEAIAGGGMEEVEAVGNAKYGTAVFHFDPRHHWQTEGRAIFNLNPSEAVHRFHDTLEPVAQKC